MIRKYSLDVLVGSFKEGSKEMGLALGLLRYAAILLGPTLNRLRYQLHKLKLAAVITGLPIISMLMSTLLSPVVFISMMPEAYLT